MLEQVERNVGLPQVSTADAGDDGEATIEKLEATGIELLVPPDRQEHGERAVAGALPQGASTTDWMRSKLRTAVAAALYRVRKAIVEPVFGPIKGVRWLRRFLLRGLAKVRDEFLLIALTHNLLKLHRHRGVRALAGTT
jgi:hypothetical protein